MKNLANHQLFIKFYHVISHMYIEQHLKLEVRKQVLFLEPVNLPQALISLLGEKLSHATASQTTLTWPNWGSSTGTENSAKGGETKRTETEKC